MKTRDEMKTTPTVLLLDSETNVLPHEVKLIVVHPLVPFRPRSLRIPEALAKCFDIIDLSVGRNSQFVQTIKRSGTLFVPRLEHCPKCNEQHPVDTVRLWGDVAHPGMTVSAAVQNIGDVPRRFSGSIEGDGLY